MKKRVLTLVAITMLVTIASAAVWAEDADKTKHEYVGVKKCKICHKKDGTHPSWLETKHAVVWDSLSVEEQKNEEIQRFYTTGTTAKGELLAGVQCEACHRTGKLIYPT